MAEAGFLHRLRQTDLLNFTFFFSIFFHFGAVLFVLRLMTINSRIFPQVLLHVKRPATSGRSLQNKHAKGIDEI